MFSAEASFAFPAEKRLDQAGVLAVLKRGKRLTSEGFEIKFLISRTKSTVGNGKIAISVPKRLLKSSVSRNRIKRLVREVFRGHCAATAPLHMFVNYRVRNEGRLGSARRRLRMELASLFDDALLRARPGNSGAREA